MGLFLDIAWPFILPYYLFKTRGADGPLVIRGFAGVYLRALLTGMMVCDLLIY